MTHAERARMGGEVARQRGLERHRKLIELRDEGVNLKRAAYEVGWSYRSAKRWHRQETV